MVSIKLSDEQLAALGFGADAKPEVILSALQSAQQTRAQLQQNESTFTASLGTITQTLETVVSRLNAVEARKPELAAGDKDALLAKAKEAAEAAAGTAVINMAAKLGGKAAGQNDKPSDVTNGAPKPSETDFKAQYEASQDLQAEFPSLKHYETFKRMEAEGRVQISSK